MYVSVYACICMYCMYVYLCVCMCVYMCVCVYIISICIAIRVVCACMGQYDHSITPFDTIFPLRPIQIGCLDYDLSTALFPSQHTASRRKALSTVPSLRCFPITLLGLLAMRMVTGC